MVESLGTSLKPLNMLLVAIKGNAAFDKLFEGQLFPMIGMDVGEQDRMDVIPGSQEEHESCGMNSATTNGASSGRCSRTSHAAFAELNRPGLIGGSNS